MWSRLANTSQKSLYLRLSRFCSTRSKPSRLAWTSYLRPRLPRHDSSLRISDACVYHIPVWSHARWRALGAGTMLRLVTASLLYAPALTQPPPRPGYSCALVLLILLKRVYTLARASSLDVRMILFVLHFLSLCQLDSWVLLGSTWDDW